jgi:hypothetical protein
MSNAALIEDLRRALVTGTDAQRLEMLSRMTDLFLAGADRFSPEQIRLFDEMLTKFLTVVETGARARLADRLAPVSNAPAGVIRTLAFDDDIAVARPVLRESPAIEDSDLVANANTKSQQHLLAISERKRLSEAVTDVLVTRGDTHVAQSVAKNADARFSFAGFRTLVRRAHNDDNLTTLIGKRPDMPRQHMLRLLDAASDKVRAQVLAQDSKPAVTLRDAPAPVEETVGNERGAATLNYSVARPKVEAMHRAGTLNQAAIVQFAREKGLAEIAVALSLLCEVSIDVVERALLAPASEMVLILAKIAGFSWTSAQSVLLLKAAERGMSQADLDEALRNFGRLNVGTARKMLGFYSMRSQGLAAVARGT